MMLQLHHARAANNSEGFLFGFCLKEIRLVKCYSPMRDPSLGRKITSTPNLLNHKKSHSVNSCSRSASFSVHYPDKYELSCAWQTAPIHVTHRLQRTGSLLTEDIRDIRDTTAVSKGIQGAPSVKSHE